MRLIQKTVIVSCSSKQMYELVNDIESYPRFLPWCSAAEIENSTDEALVATVSLALGKIKQSFTTRNTLQPGKRIDMDLVRGPFKQLTGHWKFEDIEEHACRVQLELNFEFENKMLVLTFNKAFEYIMYALIDAFETRAIQVYGKQ